MARLLHSSAEEAANLVEEGGCYPCEAYGVGDGEESPAPSAALVLDGYNSRDAGHIE